MNRRDFIRLSAAVSLGFNLLPLFPLAKAAASPRIEGWEPPIYRRFLQFTEYEKRPGTDRIVIHNTGFPTDKDSTAAEIHEFHQKNNGWAGIGYHYLIRKNGMIEQGRRPGMIGAHAYHYNKTSIGICLAGNFNLGQPTKEQLDSLKLLTAWLCEKYHLAPMKNGVIVGHRDLNDTDCPGDNLYSRLPEIRRYCRDFEH